MKERTVNSSRVFSGRLLTLDVEQVELEDGTVTFREIVGHPGAVAVLSLEKSGRFVLVRQYRKSVEKELIEIVAGVMRHGEEPEDCARREVQEETGRAVLSLEKLGVIYPSPGYTRETLHIFFATVITTKASSHTMDDDERIEVVLMERNEIETAIRDGVIRDSKTLAAWSLYLLTIEKRNCRL